nr:ribonuclease H-like domain-containing protein [Tanacetum cinerariifolium]
YRVPTGRVIVPAGRYIVLTGSVIVTTGRYRVPTGRVIVPAGWYIVPTGSVIVTTGRVGCLLKVLISVAKVFINTASYILVSTARRVKARFGGNVESKKMRKSMLKQEFLKFRISEAEGVHKGYDRMQKILSQLNQLNAKPDTEEINLRFLRALPSSWFQVADVVFLCAAIISKN